MHKECFDGTTPQVEPVLPHSMGHKRWGASKEACNPPFDSKPSMSTSTSSCWRRRRSWSWTRSLAASSRWSRSLPAMAPTWKARLRLKGFRMTSASCSTGVHPLPVSSVCYHSFLFLFPIFVVVADFWLIAMATKKPLGGNNSNNKKPQISFVKFYILFPVYWWVVP